MTTLIHNATIVNEGKEFAGDVLIKNGYIEKIAASVSPPGYCQEVDASGLLLLPGLIDDQVHFREPGLTHKATIYSESKAAVAGGVTSFMEMPNTQPPTLTLELLEDKYRKAQITSLANYAFYLGASHDNLEEIKRIDPNRVAGVKIFMGSSTGHLLVDNLQVLENIFRSAPVLVAVHCETNQEIAQQEQKFRAQYGDAIPMHLHPVIRHEQQCLASSSLAVSLAKQYGTRLHILHISTAEELALFRNDIPVEQKTITAEACVHHLYFTADDYERLGPLIKCNPAIKAAHHKQQLLEALRDGRIDVVATDHAPHTWEEKFSRTASGAIDYFRCPAGIPLVQHGLSIMGNLVHQGALSWTEVVEKMCHAPARCYCLRKRGFIREGYYADLVLLDPHRQWVVKKDNIYYRCGWSPLLGTTIHGYVTHTFVNGRLVYSNGSFDECCNGMRLEFDRNN